MALQSLPCFIRIFVFVLGVLWIVIGGLVHINGMDRRDGFLQVMGVIMCVIGGLIIAYVLDAYTWVSAMADKILLMH